MQSTVEPLLVQQDPSEHAQTCAPCLVATKGLKETRVTALILDLKTRGCFVSPTRKSDDKEKGVSPLDKKSGSSKRQHEGADTSRGRQQEDLHCFPDKQDRLGTDIALRSTVRVFYRVFGNPARRDERERERLLPYSTQVGALIEQQREKSKETIRGRWSRHHLLNRKTQVRFQLQPPEVIASIDYAPSCPAVLAEGVQGSSRQFWPHAMPPHTMPLHQGANPVS